MQQEAYNKILDRIAKLSNLEREEIERRVEAKRAKLSGLISHDGAAQIVAAELGINFDNQKLKIDELLPGMRKVNVIAKIIRIFPVRKFTTKKGDEGKVANFILADETSNIKVVLWDTNHIDLIENGSVNEGSVIEIVNGSMRENEIHLGSFSEFKKSAEEIGEVKTERMVKEKSIGEFSIGDNISVRAFIVQSFEPKFFYVCPECRKKAIQDGGGFNCVEHGKVAGEKRALITIVVDDGTATIRAVLFHENLGNLGLTDLEDVEKLSNQREDLMGKEMLFSGSVRMNKFFNNPELNVESVKEIDLGELISKFEKN